jgi:hypothetical protein
MVVTGDLIAAIRHITVLAMVVAAGGWTMVE